MALCRSLAKTAPFRYFEAARRCMQSEPAAAILDSGWTLRKARHGEDQFADPDIARPARAARQALQDPAAAGRALGYRAAQSGTGAWIVIASNGKGGQWRRFGHADDKQPADGSAVLSYEQAALKARALARGDANAAADRPASISEAITAYEADLTARGRNAYNAGVVRTHLPPHLAAKTLAQVTAKQLRHWRDALIKGGMLPATVNRTLKPAHAAFNLAAKLDPRVAANAQAWKVGLEALRGTVTARDAVLADAQVIAVVAAAYDVSAAFGLYCQATPRSARVPHNWRGSWSPIWNATG